MKKRGARSNNIAFVLTSVIFYSFLVVLAWLLGIYWDISPFMGYRLPVSPLLDNTLVQILFGLSIGLAVVAVSRVLDEKVAAFRRVSNELRKILGKISLPEVFILALASSIGEEVFFRGFLQQVFETVTFYGCWAAPFMGLLCATTLFALMHQGGDWKVFYPWTLFALVVGFVMGGAYLMTASLVTPIVIHFTVNFLNLSVSSGDITNGSNNSHHSGNDPNDDGTDGTTGRERDERGES